MAIPTSYTDETLKAFMHSELGAIADALDWSVAGGDYDRILIAAVRAYTDITDASGADDMAKLEALARREVWRAAMKETAGDFDFRADGGQYSRSQIHAQCKAQFDLARDEALPYDAAYAVTTAEISWDYAPYTPEESS